MSYVTVSDFVKHGKKKAPILKSNLKYVTTSQYAEMMGVARQTVSDMCRSGMIPETFKFGRDWRIGVEKDHYTHS